jgi:hypothetical protein
MVMPEMEPVEAPPATYQPPPRAELSRRPAVVNSRPVAPQPVVAPQPASGGGFGGLFRKVTGVSANLRRRTLTEPEAAPTPMASQHVEPPQMHTQPVQQMSGIDIPTFLRRQSN